MITTVVILTFATSGKADEAQMTKEKYFSLMLPPGFTIRKEPSAEDFESYTVTDGKSKYVEIYVGNAPNYPQLKEANGGEMSAFGDSTLRLISLWKKGELVALEFLAVRLLSPDWPRYVHGWTVEGGGEMRLARQILLSIKVTD